MFLILLLSSYIKNISELKMACGRIQIASNKKSALLKQNMREVAKLLAEDPPKEEKARIRAEALIRDDNLIEAYEILQLECELLHERIKLLQYSKACPHDLVSVVSTLIWASHRVDIPELLMIRKQFVAKYGKDFEQNAMRNYDGCLNERVVSKLSVEPPAAYLVQTYLERICEQVRSCVRKVSSNAATFRCSRFLKSLLLRYTTLTFCIISHCLISLKSIGRAPKN